MDCSAMITCHEVRHRQEDFSPFPTYSSSNLANVHLCKFIVNGRQKAEFQVTLLKLVII
jgi:hypothetical protein